ncbi:MAG: response regulator, partial [Spirochaetota bacterium]
GRIFAPFVQLGSPFTKTAGGAGIGLSLARNIVRALGGEIRLESKPGQGSLFSILVPVGQPDSVEAPPSSTKGRRIWRLLVVDDNEINLDYMAALLGSAGHRIERAESGAEALRLLEERLVDAAILDIQMPGMSGIELGRKIRGYQGERYDRSMPLVALTAFSPEEVMRSTVDFDQVLSKPADIPALIAAIDSSFAASEVEAEGFFSGTWAGRPTAGAAALARGEHDVQNLLVELLKAAETGEREGMKRAVQSMSRSVVPLGAIEMKTTLHRFSLGTSSEDPEVLATRAERLARRWGRLLAQAQAELRRMGDA